MAKKFVPRQRKHKVLARERARENGAHAEDGSGGGGAADTNVQEIVPGSKAEREARKAQLKRELRPEGVKVSGKKAKRLEKYIENKLKKDENRELLAKLAASKIDTSLFASSRSLGQTRETKREVLRRALREREAGIASGAATDEILFERRRPAQAVVEADAAGSGEDEGRDAEEERGVEPSPESRPSESTHAPAPPPAPTAAAVPVGAGLKRPLEKDAEGRPILAKRPRRGGVRSKISLAPPRPQRAASASASDEWDGFSSGGEQSGTGGEEEEEDDDDEGGHPRDDAESADSGSDSSQEEEEEEESADEEEAGSGGSEVEDEDVARRRQERSSAFKAWAQQQRNEALGYQPVDPAAATVLDVPRPAHFQPRPPEEEPLPPELQVTTAHADRKAFSVAVARDPAIQAARLQLPVVAEEQRIMEAIHNHDVVVVCGATGSGKTTQVPQFLFEAGYGAPGSPTPGMVAVTQPRRVAAVSMAQRVARELGSHGGAVAYQIRFEGTVDPRRTAVQFMTDGVLLREVARDITLRRYSAVVVDEAHERSVNTDILLGMLSRVVRLRAELAAEDPPAATPLKLVIMSATLRVGELTANRALFATPPPVIEVEGRQHPVTVHFARRTRHDYVEEAFRKVSRGHRQLPPGGFLVFLTGQGEIAQLGRRLQAAFGGGRQSAPPPRVRLSASEAPVEAEDVDFGDRDDDRNVADADGDEAEDDDDDDADDDDDDADFAIEDEAPGTGPAKMHILPLYSLLPTREQMKVFEPPPDGARLVVLATNVAETSLTIPGVRYVFDCGRSKERRYDRRSGVQSFEIGWISKASAQQRAGRAGRTGPGHCYRLYSSAVYERDFAEFADPEILRTPIEGVVLQLKAMHLQHVARFPFPTPPDRASLARAERLLSYLAAVAPPSAGGQVTPVGATMSLFPIAPRFARILLVGHLHDCLPYTIALVAGLSAPEVFIPESQAIPSAAAADRSHGQIDDEGDDGGDGDDGDDGDEEGKKKPRSGEEMAAESRRAAARRAYHAVHRNFCALDERSDAIKLLQVVGEFAHEPTEAWCAAHFVRYKMLREIQQLRRQLAELLRTHIPRFAHLRVDDRLDPPTPRQVAALKQMVAAGFVDQVALRADRAPHPPAAATQRKPRRAIDVPYLPLVPLEAEGGAAAEDQLVYIHPSSPLAHLSADECPDYVVYAYLQRAGNVLPGDGDGDGEKKKRPKTRMHALTDVTGGQLAALAKGTPLLSYGKPIKEVQGSEAQAEGGGGPVREVWVVPYLRAEGTGGMGWPLPARKVRQRRVAGKGWVVE